jgi:hypothetical protein
VPPRSRRACLTVIAILAAPSAPATVEVANDYYGVIITNRGTPADRAQESGFFTAYTGTSHPVTDFLGQPGEILSMARRCVLCTGPTHISFAVVRSFTSGTDYTLGKNTVDGLFSEAEPGYSCVSATDVTLPVVESLTATAGTPGARATWELVGAPDSMRVEETLRIHGSDFIGGAIELTLGVTNTGANAIRLGLRHVCTLRISGVVDSSNPAGLGGRGRSFIGLRPTDPPLEPFHTVETEWWHPTFRMWQAHADNPWPSLAPFRYSVAAAATGPATLDPPPTPPDLIRYAPVGNIPGLDQPGSATRCFWWDLPDPPRPMGPDSQTTMTTYWGPTEEEAIDLLPGEEFRATQYMVAFVEYPLEVTTAGPWEAPCAGATTRVAVDGIATLAEPTVAPVRYRWSSPDPAVAFVDPTTPTTEVDVTGVGTFPVTFTTSVGAYEASSTATVTVSDAEPPMLADLRVTPAVMWPPNHRLVNVCVSGGLVDACDPAPRLRLVDARSDEPDDARGVGDGHTVGDIQEADLGIDDRCVLLRAERDGTGDGRTYTLTYEAEDWAGNVARQEVEVVVPHDLRRGAARSLPMRLRAGRP